MLSRAAALILICGLLLALAACGGDKPDAADSAAEAPSSISVDIPAEPEATPVSYDNDFGTSILPIVEESCAGCHMPGGPGAPHMKLATAGDVAAAAPLIAGQVGERLMPPWPAGGDSVEFKGDRRLRDDQVDAVLAWAKTAELDVPAGRKIAATRPVDALPRVDDEIVPAEGYAQVDGERDHYRCQIYDPGVVGETAWLQGFEFVPDQTEIVHHAIAYKLSADAREDAEAAEAASPGPGWPCFGSSGLNPADEEFALGWAPGQAPTRFPEGSGFPLEPGEFLVMQVHYHYEVQAPADRSSLRLEYAEVPADGELDEVTITEFLAPAEIPCGPGESGPLCDREAALAEAIRKYGPEGVRANIANSVCGLELEDVVLVDGVAGASCTLPARAGGEIVSILGHEHEIGKSFRMVLNPDTPEEKVLLDIPRWSFDWQFNYEPVETIAIEPSDRVRIECSWDRGLRDPDLPPAYVLWADGSDDEMCFATIITRATG